MLKEYIKILVMLLILDIPVIMYINNKMYFTMFNKINNNKNMIINNYKIISAILAYLFLAYAIYYFIIKKNLTKFDALILGIIIYGVYNTTNYFSINNYSGEVAIKDTIWGGILFYLVTSFYRA